MSVWEAQNRALLFLLQLIYPPMFMQVDEGECVGAGKTTVVFLPLQFLLLLTDNGITHKKKPLPVSNSSVTSTSLCSYSPRQLPCPKPPPAGFSLLPLAVRGEIKFRWKWNIHFHSATDGHLNLIQLLMQHLLIVLSHHQTLFFLKKRPPLSKAIPSSCG